jgi:hypothetical protein
MTAVLWLLAIQGAIGAFDTLYFHEGRARLPALGRQARPELRLHAARSLIYAVLFGTLPHLAWQGLWAAALCALLLAEIGLTLADFVVEDSVRRPLGGVFPGERVTHAVMGIVYGAMLAHLVPVLAGWLAAPTALRLAPPEAPAALRWALTAMGLGVLLSGARDLAAALGLPHSGWPWRTAEIPGPGTRP